MQKEKQTTTKNRKKKKTSTKLIENKTKRLKSRLTKIIDKRKLSKKQNDGITK